jgi:hypothetical protein
MLIRVTPLTQDEQDQLTAMVKSSPLANTTLLGRTPSGRLLDFKAEDVVDDDAAAWEAWHAKPWKV